MARETVATTSLRRDGAQRGRHRIPLFRCTFSSHSLTALLTPISASGAANVASLPAPGAPVAASIHARGLGLGI